MQFRSPKRTVQEAEYRKLRDCFLVANPVCQLCHILPSTQVHHMAGREGSLLLYTPWWRAACDGCHSYCTRHKQEAIERGWSLPRSLTLKGNQQWQNKTTHASEHGIE
jgi:hypothetical protein